MQVKTFRAVLRYIRDGIGCIYAGALHGETGEDLRALGEISVS